jgi:hypothetical protein
MSDAIREAFEKWWPSVGQTIGKVAAWEAWQAAQAQTLLEVIRDASGCHTKALQSGEPVAAALINKWIKEIRADCAMYGDDAHTETIARYVADKVLQHTTPPPVAGANVLISIDLLQAALNSLREAATHASPADKVYLASTIKLFSNLLSAGKGGEE